MTTTNPLRKVSARPTLRHRKPYKSADQYCTERVSFQTNKRRARAFAQYTSLSRNKFFKALGNEVMEAMDANLGKPGAAQKVGEIAKKSVISLLESSTSDVVGLTDQQRQDILDREEAYAEEVMQFHKELIEFHEKTVNKDQG
jgi:hypothetical protein